MNNQIKKYFFSATMILVGMSVSAQNINDALRYSSAQELNGTARFKAMSGAFGALGGDLSGININPAGSSAFSSSEFGFSFGNTNSNFKNQFHNASTTNKDSDFYLNQIGGVFPIIDYNPDAKWKKFTLSVNYNLVQNFYGNDLSLGGTSNKNLGDYFKYYADGVAQQDLLLEEYDNKIVVNKTTLSDLYSQMGRAGGRAFKLRNALLGHYVGLINPAIGRDEINPSDSDEVANNILNEKNYVSNTQGATEQRFGKVTEGDIRKYNFNFSTQYGDNIYLGLNINTYAVNYKETLIHQETYANSSPIRNATFENQQSTTGSGISFQLGAIAKITKELRLGVSYESPTWYDLQTETLQSITANNRMAYAYPDVVVVYPEYKLRTPSSWTASVAYIFGKSGLISMDYIYKGYGNMQFQTDFLKPENSIIQNELGDVNILRFGGEYRIKALSLRGGMRYEQSPYKVANKRIGNLKGYSLGAGYSFGSIRLDVSYDIAKQDFQYQPYESVLTTPAYISATRNSLIFTLSAKLF